MEVRIWQPNFNFQKCVSRKHSLNDFLQMPYDFFLDVFSAENVVYYRKIDGSADLVGKFQVSKVVLSIKNSSNNFFQIRFVKLFLDAFWNVLAVHYIGKLTEVRIRQINFRSLKYIYGKNSNGSPWLLHTKIFQFVFLIGIGIFKASD